MPDTNVLTNNPLTRDVVYPFANATFLAKHPPICVEGGDGVYISDSQGNRFLDGQAGLWNVNVGHGRKEIKDAIIAQIDKLSYYSTFGLTTNKPSVDLASMLVRMTAQEGMTKAFFSSGGSEANEAAIKLARQYWRLMGHPARTKIISLRRAYHGVTLGALSANGYTYYREPFEPLLPGFIQTETPYLYRNPFTTDHEELGRLCAELLEREIIYQGPNSVAAFMAEPVQGAGGVIVPPPGFWPRLREICDRHGVLFIADEVVTGFGRLGSMFGSRAWGVKPDMMVFAKGINSGYVPLGATMINARVAEPFDTEDDAQFTPRAFAHGNTYAGHPLACAAAMANLKIVEDEDLPANAGAVGAHMLARFQALQDKHHNIGDVRGKGLMLGIELVADRATKKQYELTEGFGHRIWERCIAKGVLIRNLAETFIISPPLTLTMAQADLIVDTFDEAIGAVAAG